MKEHLGSRHEDISWFVISILIKQLQIRTYDTCFKEDTYYNPSKQLSGIYYNLYIDGKK